MSALRTPVWAVVMLLLGAVTACGGDEPEPDAEQYCDMVEVQTLEALVGEREMKQAGTHPKPDRPASTCQVWDPRSPRKLALSVYTAFHVHDEDEERIRGSIAESAAARTETSSVHLVEGEFELVSHYEKEWAMAATPTGPAAFARAVTPTGEVSLWIYPDLRGEMSPDDAVSLAVAAAKEIAPRLQGWAEGR